MQSLRLLDVSRNRLGPRSAEGFAASLRRNPTLRILKLGWNQLGTQGTRAIIRSLSDREGVRPSQIVELRVENTCAPGDEQEMMYEADKQHNVLAKQVHHTVAHVVVEFPDRARGMSTQRKNTFTRKFELKEVLPPTDENDKPIAELEPPPSAGPANLGMYFDASSAVVESVVANSQAARQGIQAGWQALSIDGELLGEKSIDEVLVTLHGFALQAAAAEAQAALAVESSPPSPAKSPAKSPGKSPAKPLPEPESTAPATPAKRDVSIEARCARACVNVVKLTNRDTSPPQFRVPPTYSKMTELRQARNLNFDPLVEASVAADQALAETAAATKRVLAPRTQLL